MYIDDAWVKGSSYQDCYDSVGKATSLFSQMGFIIHPDKSHPMPSQQATLLGFIVNSFTMLITLPMDKTDSALRDCHKIFHKRKITVWDVAHIIGIFISLLPVCPLGRAHYRSLEIIKLTALKESGKDFESMCTLTDYARTDVQWWIKHLPHAVTPIRRGKPDMVLHTDASDYGWGAYFKGVHALGKFTHEQKEMCINSKETIAMYNGYCSFEPYMLGSHLLVRSDNTTAIAFFRDIGGLLSPVHDHFARKLWDRAAKANVWLSVSHIKGSDNFQADLASRLFNDRTEWSLPQLTFMKIAQRFRCSTIDMFATMLNHKLKRYVSWFPDPKCMEVDAFSISWQGEYPYLYLPFNLTYRCLEINQDQEIDKAIIVFPLWPNQQWFPQLLRMLVTPSSATATQESTTLPSMGRPIKSQDPNKTATAQNSSTRSGGCLRSQLEMEGISPAITAHISRGL